ncbi:hypothetical protein FKM82_011997 [Ascaphus truei]
MQSTLCLALNLILFVLNHAWTGLPPALFLLFLPCSSPVIHALFGPESWPFPLPVSFREPDVSSPASQSSNPRPRSVSLLPTSALMVCPVLQ